MTTSLSHPKFDWKTFKWILLAGLVVRLIAAIFSQGYGMFDDHFLIIDPAASWVHGYDNDYWLPWSEYSKGTPKGHSYSYIGLNFIYFWLMDFMGVTDPKSLMLINRLLHALFSMITVWFGIKIVWKLAGEQQAKIVGWLLALLWVLPFVSVRNLVEVTASPFLVMGVWYLIRERKAVDFLVAGLLVGLSVSFRYQVGIFAVGLAAVYFFRFQWKSFALFCLGVLLMFSFTQGLIDFLIWGYPFAEFIQYTLYNASDGTQYMPNSNYFMYFFVLMGCFLVPLGLVLMVGFFRSWKKYAIIFVPTFLFLIFHTIYPNRQERFILTILPFFTILGVLGYQLFKETKFKERLFRVSMIAFWVLNIPFLLFAMTTYSKKSRIESAYALFPYRDQPKLVLLEGSSSGRVSPVAKFYTGDWELQSIERRDTIMEMSTEEERFVDYIFFHDDKEIDQRIERYRKLYPKMTKMTECEPGLIDALVHKANPINANEYIEIWRTNIEKPFAKKRKKS